MNHLDAIPTKQRRPLAYIIFVLLGLVMVSVGLYAYLAQTSELPESITLTQEPFEQYKLDYVDEIAALGKRYDVDPYLICAVINTESKWNAHARSQAGAVGLMQMMPETAEWMVKKGLIDDAAFPLNQLEDPRVNMEYGVCYLSYLMKRFDNLSKVVAGYNGGPANVERWEAAGGADFEEVIDYPETKEYVSRVRTAYRGYQREYPQAFNGASTQGMMSAPRDGIRS